MASEKGLHVADLLGAPGLTSTLRERLQAADADGDGFISASEMMDVMQREITATRDRKMMVRVLAALSVACVLIIAAVVGLTYAVVQMSKDTSVENNVLVGKDGLQPLSTATLQQTTPLRDLYQATSPSEVDWLTHLTVPFGNGTGIFRIQDVFLVPGQRVRFDTAAEGVSVEVTAEGVTVSGDEQAPGGRRRLMQSEGDPGSVTGPWPLGSSSTNNFYLAPNGVTVLCPDAKVGETGMVGGVTYTRVNQSTLKSLAKANSPQLTTSCTTGITKMNSLFFVRAAPSRVLLILCRCVVVVAHSLSPRFAIAPHSTRPPVSRCAVVCQRQSAHRWLGRELGDDHG
jgi:hypothetical protein